MQNSYHPTSKEYHYTRAIDRKLWAYTSWIMAPMAEAGAFSCSILESGSVTS